MKRFIATSYLPTHETLEEAVAYAKSTLQASCYRSGAKIQVFELKSEVVRGEVQFEVENLEVIAEIKTEAPIAPTDDVTEETGIDLTKAFKVEDEAAPLSSSSAHDGGGKEPATTVSQDTIPVQQQPAPQPNGAYDSYFSSF